MGKSRREDFWSFFAVLTLSFPPLPPSLPSSPSHRNNQGPNRRPEHRAILRKSDTKETHPPSLPISLPPSFKNRDYKSINRRPKRRTQRNSLSLPPSLPSSKTETTKALTEDLNVAQFYEKAVESHQADAKEAAKWLIGDIFGHLNGNKGKIKDFDKIKLTPAGLAELVGLIAQGKITGKIAKEILPELLDEWVGEGGTEGGREGGQGAVLALVKERGMEAITDPVAIALLVQKVVEANPEKVADYRGGKTKMLGFFVGMVLKESGSRADPEVAQELTVKALNKGM